MLLDVYLLYGKVYIKADMSQHDHTSLAKICKLLTKCITLGAGFVHVCLWLLKT